MKAAMAMEKASAAEGAGSGLGMGMGLMMPAMFAQYFGGGGAPQGQAAQTTVCAECQNSIPADSKFCPRCGHQQLIFHQCQKCGKNLPPTAKFCPRCGHPVEEKVGPKICSKCKYQNLAESIFCNQCGEKL
jgi:RNA polymerase subunit RPABC4/transcription elongation factor Spt4